jgi:NAD(P)-dependent dehydrogenase (short-subunit alcohol dehydrogenase family)
MLSGRVIIVTGGFGRLGPSLAEAIEAAGGTAIVTSRDQQRVSQFNKEARHRGQKMRASTLRVRGEEDIDTFIEDVLAEFDSVHGLINNAYAALGDDYSADGSFESWETSIRANVACATRLATSLVERRARSNVRSIVNIASIYGVVAPDFSMYPDGRDPPAIEYGATKAALIYVTKFLAAQWGELDIRVNAISPGGIRHEQSEEFLGRYAKTVPMGRMVDKLEVAQTACFLLAAGSSGITGQNVIVDGGRCIW